jgi:hypothetical protein
MTTRASGADLLAGLSIAGLLLPEAVADSGVAQLPPQAGVIGVFADFFPLLAEICAATQHGRRRAFGAASWHSRGCSRSH